MATKYFEKHFEDFIGVDYRSSDLSRQSGAAKQLTNALLLRNLSLSGRKGGKISGQYLDFYYGLYNYIYRDSATGTTQEQLVAVDEGVLNYYTSATLTITYVAGATDYGYSLLVNEATNTFRFVLTQGGSPVTLSGNPYFDLGTGVEGTGLVTLLDLANAIDATANFAAALSTTAVNSFPAAIIALAQVFATTTSPKVITFNYFTPAQTSYFVNDPLASIDVQWTQGGVADAQFSSFLNKKSVLFIAGPSVPTRDAEPYIGRICKYDGHGVYVAGMPPAYRALSGSSSGGSALNGTYKYIYSYVFIDAKGNTIEGQELPFGDALQVTLSAAKYTLTIPCLQSQVSVDRSDPSFSQLNTTGALVLGAHVGVTRIHIQDPSPFTAEDRIMIFDRITSEWIRDQVSAVGRDGTGSYIDISTTINANNNDQVYLSPWDGFWDHCAIVNGLQSLVNTITVENNSVVTGGGYRAYNSITVGDVAYFFDKVGQKYTTRNVTAVTATTITISGDPVTVDDEIVISANLRIRIYRTKAGGAEYYRLADVPHDYFNTTTTFVDAYEDTLLGAIFNPLTEDRGLPPKASFLVGHQGLMVTSGISGAPNRVHAASVESPEYFSGLTAFDIESTVTGPIRAIASDNEDMLAVFKDDAYYNVVGDLASSSQTVQAVREGQNGISSHSSIARVRDAIVGVGPSGFVAIQNGKVIDDFSGLVDPKILQIQSSTSQQYVLRHASAINDWQNQLYICNLPAETTVGTVPSPNSNSILLVYDYYNLTWKDWSFDSSVLPYGQFTFYQKRLYWPVWFSVSTTAYSVMFKRHQNVLSDLKYDYADNTKKITYDFWLQWEGAGDPSIYKLFERLKVYCMQPSFFVPFVLRIRIYRDFKTSSANFDTTMTFSTTADIEKVVKFLQGYKSRVLSVRFTTDAIHAVPLITGYEFGVSDSYQATDLKGPDR